jgi:DNA-directed RNA polymerase subunit beta
VLVGKVTPKGETQLTPEEKLLRAIFGEKASDVKDTSLRVPSGMIGTVIDVQVFTREGIERDKRAQQIIDDDAASATSRISPTRCASSSDDAFGAYRVLIDQQSPTAVRRSWRRAPRSRQGYLDDLERNQWFDIAPRERGVAPSNSSSLRDSIEQTRRGVRRIAFEAKKKKLTSGDELPPGVQKMVKVYLGRQASSAAR